MAAISISKKDFKKLALKNKKSEIQNNGGIMKNKLTDLNNHLFEQLERLNDEDLTDAQLQKEIERSKAMTGIANSIINNAKVVLDAAMFLDDSGYTLQEPTETLKMIGIENEK